MGRFKVLVAVWVVVTTVCVIRQSVMLRETHDTIREMVSFQGAVVSVIQSVPFMLLSINTLPVAAFRRMAWKTWET